MTSRMYAIRAGGILHGKMLCLRLHGGVKGKGEVYATTNCMNTESDYRKGVSALLNLAYHYYGIDASYITNLGPYKLTPAFMRCQECGSEED